MLPLLNSQADVLAKVLVALGLGSEPAVPVSAWPVYFSQEPGAPDNCITVYDTGGREDGNTQHGEHLSHPGVQVRVRATTAAGFAKASAIAVALSAMVDREVSFDDATYVVDCFTQTSDVLALGTETGISKRLLFTVNGVLSLWRTS